MNNTLRFIRKYWLLPLLATLLLHGCIPTITLPTGPDRAPSAQSNEAAAFVAKSDFLGAAQTYLRLADQSRPPEQLHYRMQGIEYLLRINRDAEAKAQLAKLRLAPGDDAALRARYALAQAMVAQSAGDINTCAQWLHQATQLGIPATQREAYHTLAALLAESRKEYLKAAEERARLDSLLTAGFDKSSNQSKLWQDLTELHTGAIPAAASKDNHWNGWLDLARTTKETPPGLLAGALAQWRARYPGHPGQSLPLGQGQAASALFPSTPPPLPDSVQPLAAKAHIALLLPQSGKFALPAQAVQEGFLAAWYEDSGAQYPVRVYHADQGNAGAAYQQALQAGARFVVGPLEKSAIEALLQQSNTGGTSNGNALSVPALFLNALENTAVPANVYQFALAPEDEVEAVASQAWAEGHTTAGVLYPTSDKGGRLLQAFHQAFGRMGGKIVEAVSYDAQNYATAAQTIAAAYKQKSISVLFLVAKPEIARQIKPMINYHLAHTLPILALGQIYSGHPSPRYDEDLSGIRFVEMPWLFPETNLDTRILANLQQQSPQMMQEYQRLAAFGLDAYRLARNLLQQGNSGQLSISGATGKLELDASRRFRRTGLVLATFQSGRPVPSPHAP